MLNALEARLKVLDQALHNAKMNIQQCSEHLEAAKVQFNTVVGHHKECCYQIEQAKKAQEVLPPKPPEGDGNATKEGIESEGNTGEYQNGDNGGEETSPGGSDSLLKSGQINKQEEVV